MEVTASGSRTTNYSRTVPPRRDSFIAYYAINIVLYENPISDVHLKSRKIGFALSAKTYISNCLTRPHQGFALGDKVGIKFETSMEPRDAEVTIPVSGGVVIRAALVRLSSHVRKG